jgi:hypothetical protein
MLKVNFKKLGKQFLAGLFGFALMCGVMLNTQTAEAQRLSLTNSLVKGGGDECEHGSKTWRTEWSDEHNSTMCSHGGNCCCVQGG